MTRAEIIKKIRYILQSGQCPSYFTNKCKNDGACGRCENEAMDRLIAEYDAQIRVDERTKAEIDFQNSDYWNDYLAKVLADERAKAFKEFVDLYREFCNAPSDESCLKEDIECEGMCIDCFEKWLQQRSRNE